MTELAFAQLLNLLPARALIASTAIVISSASRFLSASSSVTSSFWCDCFTKATHESLRRDIQQERDCFFFLLLVCTFLVLAGVILEEAHEKILPKGNSYVEPESGEFVSSPWIVRGARLSVLGFWLLVIGLVGEGLFEGATSWADTILQDVNNQLLLNAEAQTGNAEKSAKTAKSEADKIAAQAELLRTQVEILGPRTLSLEEQRDLVASLGKFNGHPRVLLRSYAMDGEGTSLAGQIGSVITAATGVNIADERASLTIQGPIDFGVCIKGPNSDLAFMHRLRDSLTNIGKLKQVSINDCAPWLNATTMVVLFVGNKPVPELAKAGK